MCKSMLIFTTLILGLSAVVPHLPALLVTATHCPQGSFFDLPYRAQSANTHQDVQWLGVKSIRVLDSNNLWIVAQSVTQEPFEYSNFILHSSDRGRSCEMKLRETDRDLNDVCFINQKVGWACGSGGLILKSTDGGKTWTEQETPSERDLDEIQFINADVGWAAGGKGEVLRTTDGGQRWASHRIEVQGELFVLRFRDSLNGWLIGHGNQAYESTDGGETWKSRADELARLVAPSGADYSYFQAVKFFGPKAGLIGAHIRCEVEVQGGKELVEKNVIFKTDDGGHSWRVLFEQAGDAMNSAEFVSENEMWMILENGASVLHSEDGGRSWDKTYKLPSSDILDLYFVDSRNGWAVGGNDPFRNRLYYTRDGGKNWTQTELRRITHNRN